MTIDSPAVLLVQNDVAPGREPGFDAWYLADHLPDRVGTEGFRRARRWRAFEGAPRDLSLYEIDAREVMSSGPYLARLAAPTEGTRRNMDALLGMIRSVCDVHGAEGYADGGCAAVLPVLPPITDAPLRTFREDDRWRPDPETGVVARALLHCDSDASQSDTVEGRLRPGRDRHIAAAAWIEVATPEQAAAALDAARLALQAAGLVAGVPALLRLVATFRAGPP